MSDLDRIRDALNYVPASDRDTWLRMGMAVKSELADSGFDIWEEWSQQDESFDPRAASSVWKSIHPHGGVTIGTLFHEAKGHGWSNGSSYPTPTPEEMAERQRKAEERAAQEKADITRERAGTAKKAAAIWKAAIEAKADHPYLTRKRVSPVATLREIDAEVATAILGYEPKSSGELLAGRLLVVPVKQGDRLSTLELIDADKRKTALAGRGSKAGGYWATQSLPDTLDTLLIGEGVATVLSAKEATDHHAIATLSAGNLPAVAKEMHQRYPKASLVILADLVKATGEPDPHAVEAARSVGGKVATPTFDSDRPDAATDFNDMAALHGLEAVKRAIESASVTTVPRIAAETDTERVTLIRADALTPEPIDWLWNGYLAAGKLHIIAGKPGDGKTTVALSLAATITTGGPWPNGTRAEEGNVVIWSGEDDAEDVLLPRLIAMGADQGHVYFAGDVTKDGESRTFDPARHMPLLEEAARQIGNVRMIMVDPVVTAVAADSHKNADVRRALAPLVNLAARLNAAAIGISHFSKGTSGCDPVERVTGSIAFGAVARLVYATGKSTAETGITDRVFVRAKSNIGEDGGGFTYNLEPVELDKYPDVIATRVMWGQALEGTARELLDAAEASEADDAGGALEDAKDFLRDALQEGAVPTRTIQNESKDAGHAWATVKRAKEALGIKAEKVGLTKGWTWRLPTTPLTEDAQPLGMSAFGTNERLRRCSSENDEHLRGNDDHLPPKMLKNTEDTHEMSAFKDAQNLEDAHGLKVSTFDEHLRDPDSEVF